MAIFNSYVCLPEGNGININQQTSLGFAHLAVTPPDIQHRPDMVSNMCMSFINHVPRWCFQKIGGRDMLKNSGVPFSFSTAPQKVDSFVFFFVTLW